jgi:hypothetical protein
VEEKPKVEEEKPKEENNVRDGTFDVQKQAPKGKYHFPDFPTPLNLADAQRKHTSDEKKAKFEEEQEKNNKNKKKKPKKNQQEENSARPPPPKPPLTMKRQFFKENEFEEVDKRALEVSLLCF